MSILILIVKMKNFTKYIKSYKFKLQEISQYDGDQYNCMKITTIVM